MATLCWGDQRDRVYQVAKERYHKERVSELFGRYLESRGCCITLKLSDHGRLRSSIRMSGAA